MRLKLSTESWKFLGTWFPSLHEVWLITSEYNKVTTECNNHKAAIKSLEVNFLFNREELVLFGFHWELFNTRPEAYHCATDAVHSAEVPTAVKGCLSLTRYAIKPVSTELRR